MAGKKLKYRAGALFVLLSFLLSGCFTGHRTGDDYIKKRYVAVILKSTRSEFFHSVMAGARAAAAEYNLYITIDGPESEEDYETQNSEVRQAAAAGAEAIVFSSTDFERTAEAINEAAKAGIKIIVIDSEVNSGYVASNIGTDNHLSGQMAAGALLAGDLASYTVGLINFDAGTANGQQREEGFRKAVFKDERVRAVMTVNVPSTAEAAKEGVKKLLSAYPEINALVAMNEWTSLGLGQAIKELGLAEKIVAVGYDSNVECIGLLESGEMDALVVQNPFAMGYLGVEAAFKAINGQDVERKVNTQVMVVTRENMYDDASQRLLFPFD